MIKPAILQLTSQGIIPGGVLALCLFTTSCKLPPREAWNQVQQRGLLPVLFQPVPSPSGPLPAPQQVARIPAASDDVLRVQAVQQPEIAKIPFATPVPGRPGYVFSPHVPGHQVVDVTPYTAGTEVRCPYTLKAFHVPDFTAEAAPVLRSQPQPSIAEVASHRTDTPVPSSTDQVPLLIPNPAPLPPETAAPTGIPFGSRVPGRPGFVYSPFAEKNQLVDVAGIAPGVEVKCPYSNKLFRVPEPLPEEIAPAPETIVPSIQSPPPLDSPSPNPPDSPTPSPSATPEPPPQPAKPPSAF